MNSLNKEDDFLIEKTSIYKNPFIGLFLKASEHFVLVPKNCPDKIISLAEKVLGVEAIRILINQSDLLGIYTAMNSNGVVLPEFAEEEEIHLLKRAGFNICLVKGNYSAAGNNILTNDYACLVNPRISKDVLKEISDCLDCEVFQQGISNISTVGATSVVTNKGLLAYNEISEVELKKLEKIFRVKGINGSVNMGMAFNLFGISANSKGALVGETTSGFEMQRIYEGLFGD